MSQWGAVRDRVREITQDNVEDKYQVSDSTLTAYANYALDTIATRHARLVRAELEVEDQIAALPSDFLHVQSVHADGQDLSSTHSFYPEADEYSIISDSELKVGDDELTSVQLIYLGGYASVEEDNDELPVDRWLEEPLLYIVVSRSLSQLAVDSGDLSQFDTTIDSGNPEHNPLLRVAEYYEKLADRLLNRRQQK